MFLLVGVAALGSTTISATFGLLAALLGHVRTADGYAAFWAVWWVGDSLGDLLIAPFLFAWASTSRLSRRPLRWLEGAVLALLVVLVSATVFRHDFAWQAIHGIVRGTYPTVPLLIWAALRFEQRGVTSALLLVAVIAVSGAVAGNGIFGTESPHERLLLVQGYTGVTAISMLTLAAALAERRAAIRARDEFISIASHELKTPLTALKLRLGSAIRIGERLAADDGQAEKLTRALAASSTTADRLGGLVDDLLDVSRLTAGRFALRIERVDIVELLREVVGRLREQAAEVGSSIELVDRRTRRRLLGSQPARTGGDEPDLERDQVRDGEADRAVGGDGRGPRPRPRQGRGDGDSPRRSQPGLPGLRAAADGRTGRWPGTGPLHRPPDRARARRDADGRERPAHGSTFTLDLPRETPVS